MVIRQLIILFDVDLVDIQGIELPLRLKPRCHSASLLVSANALICGYSREGNPRYLFIDTDLLRPLHKYSTIAFGLPSTAEDS